MQYTHSLMVDLFRYCTGFEWDKGNSTKNWKKHKVSRLECEQVFFNFPLIVKEDTKHSFNEKRWYLLGKTELNRYIFLAFTIRQNLIRVISARDMNKKEKRVYDEKTQRNT